MYIDTIQSCISRPDIIGVLSAAAVMFSLENVIWETNNVTIAAGRMVIMGTRDTMMQIQHNHGLRKTSALKLCLLAVFYQTFFVATWPILTWLQTQTLSSARMNKSLNINNLDNGARRVWKVHPLSLIIRVYNNHHYVGSYHLLTLYSVPFCSFVFCFTYTCPFILTVTWSTWHCNSFPLYFHKFAHGPPL